MTDEVSIVTDTEVSTVVAPQVVLDVVTVQDESPVAVEVPAIEVVVLDEAFHVVEQVQDIVVVSVGEQGPPGAGGSGGGATTVTYVAGEAVGGHRVVVTDADGLAVYADNTDATHANMATKITLGAAALGADVEAQLVGQITDVSFAWTPRASLYVGTNGQMTETPPVSPAVFSKVIAVAETADTILLVQEPPVMLA